VTDRVAAEFPLATFLGMTIERTAPGAAAARLTVRSEHLNPHGSVHGAVLFAMVDTAMGAATLSVLEEGTLCASIEVQLRFCKPVFEGVLVAATEVLQAGKRIVHLEGRVHDARGELVGLATGSFAVIATDNAG